MPRRSQPDALSPAPYRILAAAARHPEHRITRPDDIKPPTCRSALQALRRRGLITDSSVESGSGHRAAGPILSPAGHAHVAPAALTVQAVAQLETLAARAPRPSTKLAILVGLLSRPDGAGIDELVATLGWLPHTTRAALTGLRKRGFTLTTIRTANAPTRYCIAADEPDTTGIAATTVPETSTGTATGEAAR